MADRPPDPWYPWDAEPTKPNRSRAVHQQHVIDWWKSRGYRVTVLSDWTLMCVIETTEATTDPDRLTDAIRRRHAARWAKP